MNTQQLSTDSSDTKALNGMLRGELAAVESYNQAIRLVPDSHLREELERMRDQHQCAVCSLRKWVREMHEPPAPSSGVWGYFTAAVTGMAAMVGEGGLLAALKRGERYGESAYRQAVGNPDLPDEVRHFIGARLLPQCQAHCNQLERLAPAASSVESA